MFEELVTLSSSEDEEDIKIVEERLTTGKQISSPSKIKKIKEIVEDLRKQGHVPVATAAKVRNIQFFSGQEPLSLEEGEEVMRRRKYKIKTVPVSVAHKRRNIEGRVQPRPQPGGGQSQRFPNSRLPVPVKPRRKITDQLRDQVEVEEGGRREETGVQNKNITTSTAVRREVTPRHRKDRTGAGTALEDGTSSQEDLFSNLVAFDTSEDEEEEEEEEGISISPGGSTFVTPQISTGEDNAQIRDFMNLVTLDTSEDEEELELVELEEQSSPGTGQRPRPTASSSSTQEVADLLSIPRPSQEEEEEGGQREVTGGPSLLQSSPEVGAETESPEEVPTASPASQSGGQEKEEEEEEGGLSQAEFLRYLGLCSLQEAEAER